MPNPPKSVRIVEVGPRDGLGNEPETVSTEAKAEFVRLLANAGLSDIEVASLDRLDIQTGVKLSGVRRASDFIGKTLDRGLPSRVLKTSVGKAVN